MNDIQQLVDALSGKPEWQALINKLDAGTGTYNEVDDLAAMVGDEIADLLRLLYSDEAFIGYTKAGHDIVSELAEVAQQNLNDAAGIGIKPMKTKYPEARIKAVIDEITGLDGDTLSQELQTILPSLMMEMVDDIAKYNMDFQAKAGLTPVIKRTWSGSYGSHDTKHTDWCHDLAGTYDYGREPSNVYARHKGCRCKVEYFPNRKAQGRITALAKGEIDRDGVLWNTRSDTLEKRLKKLNKR